VALLKGLETKVKKQEGGKASGQWGVSNDCGIHVLVFAFSKRFHKKKKKKKKRWALPLQTLKKGVFVFLVEKLKEVGLRNKNVHKRSKGSGFKTGGVFVKSLSRVPVPEKTPL